MRVLSVVVAAAVAFSAQTPPAVLEIADYAVMPLTGRVEGTSANTGLLSRVNAIREEPGGADRFFVIDQNGPVYILDKKTTTFTPYLDFNGRADHAGLFQRFFIETGFGTGLNAFAFDPDYQHNGRFYTAHIEDPSVPASQPLNARSVPGLEIPSYAPTVAIASPGPLRIEGVLVEWTDTRPSNTTFEGTARELLRVQLNTTSHPLGDMIFNPAARAGDPDWRVLYLECGDSASGESNDSRMRSNPQRLDNLLGKILRIIPDLNEHASSSRPSSNGRYRVPNDNPFVSTTGARPEIFAYGLRNPHRLSWAVDAAAPANNRLIANSVGLHTWESVFIIQRGANYGYSLREGNQRLMLDNSLAPLPQPDQVPVQIGETPTTEMITPRYPVIQYDHGKGGGDAIGSGFVYNGRAVPSLRGKYVFTDITTGRIWWADYKDMLAADDGRPDTLATIHPMRVQWTREGSSTPEPTIYDTMFPIVDATYHKRGGRAANLPGGTGMTVATLGRVDARFAIDAAGELYLYSKTDGMIRMVRGASGF